MRNEMDNQTQTAAQNTGSSVKFIGSNAITFDTPHSITLSVQDWLGVLCAVVAARTYNVEKNWNATACVRDELLEKLNAQVREQIDAAGDNEGE